MWPFTGNKTKQKDRPVLTTLIGDTNLTEKQKGLHTLTALIDDRDLLDLTENSSVLRLWLPEAGRIALQQVTKNLGMVASKYLREFFVSYLYGTHELLKMQVKKKGLYYVPPPKVSEKDSSPRVMFSRAPSVECIPGLGKNLYPFKVFLPQRIKDDLQGLADKTGIPLSQFVREILISHFFGQTFWPAKLQPWSQENERIGKEWEQEERESVSVSYDNIRPDEIDGDRVVEWL